VPATHTCNLQPVTCNLCRRNNNKTKYQHNFNTRIKYIPVNRPVDNSCTKIQQPQWNQIYKLSAAHPAAEKKQAFFSHQPNSDAIRKPVRSVPLLTRKKPARRTPRCRVPDPLSAISSPRRAIRSPLAAPRNNKKTKYQHNFNCRIKYIRVKSPVDKKCNKNPQPKQNQIDKPSAATLAEKRKMPLFSPNPTRESEALCNL
jgi:hypothetical protein